MTKSTRIGVDLGTRHIRIALLGQRPDSFFVEDAVVCDAEGNLTDKVYYRSLKKFLEQYVKDRNIKRASFTFSLPPSNPDTAGLHLLDIPTQDTKVAKKALKFEMEQQELVKSIGDIYYLWTGYTDKEDIDGTKGMNIILSTVHKQIIYELAQLRKVNWTIENIELQSVSIGRLLEGTEGYQAVVDFGYENTRLYIYEDGVLVNHELIPSGGKHLTQQLLEATGHVSMESGEHLKQHAFIRDELVGEEVEGDFWKVSRIVSEESGHVINEIKRHIRSYELQKFISIDQLYFTGGGAGLYGLTDKLHSELEKPVLPLEDTYSKKGIDMPEHDASEEGSTESCSILCANMLFDRLVYQPEQNFERYLKSQIDFLSWVVAVVSLSATLHLGVMGISNQYDTNISELTHTRTQQEETLQELSQHEQDLSHQIAESERIVRLVDNLEVQKQYLSEALYSLPEKTPKDVAIKDLTVQNGILTIKGLAKDYSNIGLFAIELEELGTVDIRKVQKNEEDTPTQFADNFSDTDIPAAKKALAMTFEINVSNGMQPHSEQGITGGQDLTGVDEGYMLPDTPETFEQESYQEPNEEMNEGS